MHTTNDTFVREFGRTTVTLRPDLVFFPQTFSGKTVYTIEDPANSSFYRVGLSEYRFMSLLDGRTTVSEAVALAARANPAEAISEQDAAAICKWLVETELAFTSESAQPARLEENARTAARARTWQTFNPAMIRMPLVEPDRFFDRVTPWVGWIYSAWSHLLGICLALVAIYHVGSRWDEFVASSRGVLARDNWLWLGLTWLVLKLLHEFSHGVVCKRYGGRLREAGAMFIMFAPVAYVDVTSSWSFRSKWQRIHTAAAGMISELLIASVAAITWSYSEPGCLSLICYNVVLTASFATLLFNANPLMKFDGYYMLSDWLEIPNLYMLGQQAVQNWGRKVLLALRPIPSVAPAGREMIVHVYGWLSLVWRTMTAVGLLAASTSLLHGAGIILTCFGAMLWFGLPAARLARFIWFGTPTEQPNRTRFAIGAGSLAATAAAIFFWVPWPFGVRAAAVVDYAPLAVVRAASPGFIRHVHVTNGQSVREGDLLLELENMELRAELRDIELALEQSKLKARIEEKNRRLAAYQAELENQQSLTKRLREKQAQVDSLTVYAPVSGRVVARHLDSRAGQYCKSGAELVAIGDETRKEVQLAITQDDLDAFASQVHAEMTVRLAGGTRVRAPLDKVNPRASQKPPHRSLCAPNGGPLAVRQLSAAPRKSDDEDELELLSPVFQGIVRLDAAQAASLWAGQRGIVRAGSAGQPVGRYLYRAIDRWVQNRVQRPSEA